MAPNNSKRVLMTFLPTVKASFQKEMQKARDHKEEL
jgi:hypothetical protein